MVSIPAGLEKMILEGKAEYKTLSMAGFNEMIIPVPDKTYIVILGYEYLPVAPLVGVSLQDYTATAIDISYLVQYLNIFNGTSYFPFSHWLNYSGKLSTYTQGDPARILDYAFTRESYDHQHRNTYIVCKQDTAVYATKMNTAALAVTLGTLPINDPIVQILGYGGLSAVYMLQNYNDTGLGRLYPMTDKYTRNFIDPNPSRYSQAFTIPQAANAADAYIDFTAFASGDYAKARLNHITLHYVKVNTEAPPQLI